MSLQSAERTWVEFLAGAERLPALSISLRAYRPDSFPEVGVG